MNYHYIIFFHVVYLFSGGYVSLSTLVAGDLFSIDVITESIGLFMLACGLASFTGTPVAGNLLIVQGAVSSSFSPNIIKRHFFLTYPKTDA